MYLTELESEDGARDGDAGGEYYLAATNRILPDLFGSLVKGNEFAGTDYVIRSRGDTLGWDGLLLYTRAELYRVRGAPRDIATAHAFYERAIALPDAPPESWRGLGLTAMRLGNTESGKHAISEYLSRKPDAADAAAMRILLESER